jgi:hypothetical protein
VVAEDRTGIGSRGNGTDLDLGMAEQETEQFAAGVTGGARDRNPNYHMHDYAIGSTIMPIVSHRDARLPAHPPRVRNERVRRLLSLCAGCNRSDSNVR